jgi:hypothetical protein
LRRSILIAIGLFLAVLGGLGLLVGDVSRAEEQAAVDAGPVEGSVSTREQVDIPPLAAGAVLVIGLGTVLFGVSRDGWRP